MERDAQVSGATGVDGGDDPAGNTGSQNTGDGGPFGGSDASNTQMPDTAVPAGPCMIAVDETFTAEALPEGFSIANVGTSFTWQWQSGTGKIPNKTASVSGGGYYLVNSYDKLTPYDARLVSPSFQIRNCKTLSLTFDHYLSVLSGNVDVSVEVRYGNAEWQTIQTWSEDLTGHETLDLTSRLGDYVSGMQVAFRYVDPEGQGIYWQLDDVKISAQ